MHAEKKLPIFLINTPLLHIPLLALTDRQNDRQRNKLILVGLGNLRFLQVHAICTMGYGTIQRSSTTTSCDKHPLGKNEFWWHPIQCQEKFYLPKDCFEYKDGTGIKIGGRQLQWWAGCNFGLIKYSSNFCLFPLKCQLWVSIWTVLSNKSEVGALKHRILLQITVQLKFLSLARDFRRVSTKISGKLQKSFLAVEMVK